MSSSPICYYLLSYNSFTAFLSKKSNQQNKSGIRIEQPGMESDSKRQHSFPCDPIEIVPVPFVDVEKFLLIDYGLCSF